MQRYQKLALKVNVISESGGSELPEIGTFTTKLDLKTEL